MEIGNTLSRLDFISLWTCRSVATQCYVICCKVIDYGMHVEEELPLNNFNSSSKESIVLTKYLLIGFTGTVSILIPLNKNIFLD